GRELRARRAHAARSFGELTGATIGVMAHVHWHVHGREGDRLALKLALGLIALLMAGEIVAGIIASSLALLSDAAHKLTDAAALALSLTAAKLAERPARGAMTYGLGRAEVLSAQANGITLLVLAGLIVYGAVSRLITPPAVNGTVMLAVALAGVLVNLLAARILRSSGERSLNVEGSYQHV